MDVVLRFELLTSVDEWLTEAERVLDLLSAKPGFQSAKVCLALDDDQVGLVVLNFDSVGNYRRALSANDIKLEATNFLSTAIDESSAFEVLVAFDSGEKKHFSSEKSLDSEEVALGESATSRAQSRLER